MHAAHQLLKKQYPHVQGLQTTLLVQTSGFSSVSEEAGYLAHGMQCCANTLCANNLTVCTINQIYSYTYFNISCADTICEGEESLGQGERGPRFAIDAK